MNTVTYRDGETGRPVVSLPREAAADCYHQGACDADVAHWLKQGQAVTWHATDAELRAMLKGWGAWDDLDTADTDTLRGRALWLAACDIAEDPDSYADEGV